MFMDGKCLTLHSGNVQLLPLKCVYLHNIKGLSSLGKGSLYNTLSPHKLVFSNLDACVLVLFFFFFCLPFHEYAILG